MAKKNWKSSIRIVGGKASRGPVFLFLALFVFVSVVFLNTGAALGADVRTAVASGLVKNLPKNARLLVYERLDGKFKVVARLRSNQSLEILRLNVTTKNDPYSRVFCEIRIGAVEGYVDKSLIYYGEATPSPPRTATPIPTPTPTPTPTSAIAYGRIIGVPDGLFLQGFAELDGNWNLAFQVPNGARVGILSMNVSSEYADQLFHLISFQGRTGYVASEYVDVE